MANTMPQTRTSIFTGIFLALIGLAPAAVSNASQGLIEPTAWEAGQYSKAWPEQILGEVVTFQTLAEKGLVAGDFQPYLNQVIKFRDLYRAGQQQATYEGVNQFMAMLEVRVGGIDSHTADAIWDFCYRVTPDQYHARDRHARAIGDEELKKREEHIRMMEEKASLSF